MRIFCIGRNYVNHILELSNEKPTQPVVFTKPDTAILRNNASFYYPDFTNDIHFEIELVLKISKEGKFIQEKFANNYFDEIGIGIDFTARDIQNELKSKGLPWDLAKGFNGSAPISEFISTAGMDLENISFSLSQNGVSKQNGNSKEMIFKFAEIISFISQYFTLKKGDLIFTGTPAGVQAIEKGDILEAYLENKLMLSTKIC